MGLAHKTAVAAVLLASAALAGCSAPHTGAQPVPPVTDKATASPGIVTDPGGEAPVVATGHGWTQAGLDGTIPAAETCHIRWTAEKEPLPDPKCTPGAVDSAVIQASLKETVCRKGGYTSSVRPPASMTDAAKLKIMAAYGIPSSDASKYELDHLVPLTTGGASDLRNLWPQPNVFVHQTQSTYVHNDKDAVEADAQSALCTGAAQLSTIQQGFARDWTQLHLPTSTRAGEGE